MGNLQSVTGVPTRPRGAFLGRQGWSVCGDGHIAPPLFQQKEMWDMPRCLYMRLQKKSAPFINTVFLNLPLISRVGKTLCCEGINAEMQPI